MVPRLPCIAVYEVDQAQDRVAVTALFHGAQDRERIGDVAVSLLQKIKERNNVNRLESPFWFPRPSAPATRYVSSVDLMWRKALVDCDMPYYPLREFARAYRDPYCPSYIISFLRQYGEHFRKIENTAELSKRLRSE